MQLALAKDLHILKPFPTGHQGTHSNHQDIQQAVLLGPLNARLL